ncbi:EAL domain-containing protein [Brenneria izadpanahii]|uniref:cyclic-guanylate-specific phosphodiesterase n=1 Tax=Brenneria izadpanahii TaxID=2722756 RepID=A0ABX7UXY8_9GAMM|nr:EAL domain-containing protein [Brenneria izadpanahii]QTF10494.1 EAL domain-containing protein [Brenneria izadpanahii]
MISEHGKKHKNHWFLLFIAGVLPLLLGLLFTFVESRMMVKRDLESTAQIVMFHTEHIAEQAWTMVAELNHFAGRPCSAISADLQHLSSVFSYFRVIGVTQGGKIYCSSRPRNISTPMDIAIQQSLSAPIYERWSRSIKGGLSPKDRPAIIFAQSSPKGYGSYVVADARYLIDLMRAVSQMRKYLLTLTVNKGYSIQVGQPIPPISGIFPSMELILKSSRYPIAIRVTAPTAESIRAWKQTSFIFLPLTVALSLIFTAITWRRLKRKHFFQDKVRKGIAKGEFSVYYQPIYNSESQNCTGVEALLRWRRSNGEWIKPEVFISIAEKEGMIIPITRHLFDLVASDIAGWKIKPGFHLGLNVAAEHLHHPDFVEDVRRFAARVASYRLNITLELTERTLISTGSDVIQRLHQLRKDGFLISIDDFGTGHCSLSYLQNFPLDFLKIDRGFIRTVSSPDEEAPILDAIINLSHRMKLGMVAEGVETIEQLTYLKQRGVIFIQGFLYARPMSNESLIVWLHYNGDRSLERMIG